MLRIPAKIIGILVSLITGAVLIISGIGIIVVLLVCVAIVFGVPYVIVSVL